jgi:hypothetical protein
MINKSKERVEKFSVTKSSSSWCLKGDASSLLFTPLASKSSKGCSLVFLDVSRGNVQWMRWNGGESWFPRQINVLGTTFVKDSRWFGRWKVVKIEEQLGQQCLGVRADWWASGRIGRLGRFLESFLAIFLKETWMNLPPAPPPCLSSVPCPLFSSLFSQPIPFYSQVKDNEIRRPSGKGFSMVGKQDGDGLMAALPMWTAGDWSAPP